jgi:lipopolysaccharide export system permease protein
MHTLHRHIFFSVLLTCTAAVGLLAFVLLTANAFKDLLGPALSGQLPTETVLRLLPLLLPYVLVYALPLGVFTGVLLVLGRMSAQHEITAARAAGLGLGYVARPVLLLGALGTVLALAVNFELMPRTRTAYLNAFADALRQNPLGLVEPRTFVTKVPNLVFYVGEKDGAALRDVWLWRLEPSGQKRVLEFLHARGGRIDFDEAAGTARLTLLNPIAERRNPDDPEDFSNTDLQATGREAVFEMPADKLLARPTVRRLKPAFLTLDQLLDERVRLAAPAPAADGAEAANVREAERMRVEVTLAEKGARALAVLVFALVAVPLGVRVSRRETSANLVVAVGLGLGYHLIGECLRYLEKYPALRPDLLLWLPPLLFLALGAWMFRRVGRV